MAVPHTMAQSQLPIEQLALDWLRLDKNPSTKAEIQSLLDAGNKKELESRLRNRIEFGTAGLRARMEAGFARMNDLTVVQASQGLCAYLLSVVPDFRKRGVVIGHDHRHHSETFAKLTAGVFLSKGVKTFYYRGLVHTPLVPFGVKSLHAACGIMITASHNPKQDNGYKVYWGNGSQIIPPHDNLIAASIMQPENLAIWSWDANLVDDQQLKCSETGEPLCVDKKDEMLDIYFQHIKHLCKNRLENSSTSLKFVYTAMHGVGTPFAKRALEMFGFKEFIGVTEQIQPDNEFTTVAFPNPEEGKGALALAMATADREKANLIFANDPDADRLAVAERQRNGQWKIFSGNQIGVMLATEIWKNWKMENGSEDGGKIYMLASAVSSKMLQRVAEVEGFQFEETLTGFKWIGNRAMDIEKEGSSEGKKVLFAYEEAIGFMVGDIVRDKDGVSALACFAELAAHLHKNGKLVGEFLEELYDKYGYFVSENSYYICHEKDTIDRIFDKIRYGGQPTISGDSRYPHALAYPKQIGGSKVNYIRDLTIGYDSARPDHTPLLPTSKSSHMISFRLDNGCYFTLRTSGTEPKIKYYIEMGGKAGAVRSDVEKELAAVVRGVQELMEPEKNGLGQRPSD